MPDPLAWIDEEAGAWTRRGLDRRLVALGGATSGSCRAWTGGALLNFASNDYLGLAERYSGDRGGVLGGEGGYGWGSGASPLVSGWREPHEALAVSPGGIRAGGVGRVCSRRASRRTWARLSPWSGRVMRSISIGSITPA